MTIEALMKVVPPPVVPEEPYDGPWEQIEKGLGSALPQDYKDLVRIYAGGTFFGFARVHLPKCNGPLFRLGPNLLTVRRAFSGPYESEYPPFWPDPGGLILFGMTDFGDYFFWRPEGPPDEWKVVATWRGDLFEHFEVFDCGITDFLAGLATGDIYSDHQTAEPVEPEKRIFEPWLPEPDRWQWRSSDEPKAS